MSSVERRQKVLEVLCRRRHDTYDNLARDFNVSKTTIRRDITALMCSYPIETVHGGRHGCVRVMDGFYVNHQNTVYDTLDVKQTNLLKKMRCQLDGDDLNTLNSILIQFAP